jgi:signal transduction histidine kinase
VNQAHRPGVRITILDTGSGIAPQHRKNLFQPFFTTKEDVGTGLGLWITRSIVEKHGGSIRVKSRNGANEHGTAFSIFLPLDGKPENAKPASLAEVGN